MATDTEVTKDLLAAEFGTPLGNADAKAEIAKVFTDTYFATKAADATHATTTAAGANGLPSARYAGQLKRAFVNWTAAVTGTPDSTNNATLTLKHYPALGVTGVTVATLAVTAAVTAFTRQAMTLSTTGANLAVVDGANFSIEVAKGGTGITLPVLSIEWEVERT